MKTLTCLLFALLVLPWSLLADPVPPEATNNVIISVPGVGTNSTVEAASARAATEAASNQGEALELLYAMVMQIISSPASLIVIIGLSIIAWLIEKCEWLPSKIIPAVCIGLGASLYWLFAAKGSVPASFPHPSAVLFVNGLVCGLVSYLAHDQIIMRFWSPRPK